jgi:transcriptional regulator with XRE-family HTH domain
VLGKRLNELRVARGLSLRALAKEAGVSPTLLSQIEREVTEPSLNTLRALSAVFGESMAALFLDPEAPSVWLSRPGERTQIIGPRGAVSYERLTRGNGPMEVLRAVFVPGQHSVADTISHPSVECLFVIRGTMTVEVAGVAHRVEAGEAISFEAIHPHRYVNHGAVDAEIILSVTPPIP